jgi:hypothetical protein
MEAAAGEPLSERVELLGVPRLHRALPGQAIGPAPEHSRQPLTIRARGVGARRHAHGRA